MITFVVILGGICLLASFIGLIKPVIVMPWSKKAKRFKAFIFYFGLMLVFNFVGMLLEESSPKRQEQKILIEKAESLAGEEKFGLAMEVAQEAVAMLDNVYADDLINEIQVLGDSKIAFEKGKNLIEKEELFAAIEAFATVDDSSPYSDNAREYIEQYKMVVTEEYYDKAITAYYVGQYDITLENMNKAINIVEDVDEYYVLRAVARINDDILGGFHRIIGMEQEYSSLSQGLARDDYYIENANDLSSDMIEKCEEELNIIEASIRVCKKDLDKISQATHIVNVQKIVDDVKEFETLINAKKSKYKNQEKVFNEYKKLAKYISKVNGINGETLGGSIGSFMSDAIDSFQLYNDRKNLQKAYNGQITDQEFYDKLDASRTTAIIAKGLVDLVTTDAYEKQEKFKNRIDDSEAYIQKYTKKMNEDILEIKRIEKYIDMEISLQPIIFENEYELYISKTPGLIYLNSPEKNVYCETYIDVIGEDEDILWDYFGPIHRSQDRMGTSIFEYKSGIVAYAEEDMVVCLDFSVGEFYGVSIGDSLERAIAILGQPISQGYSESAGAFFLEYKINGYVLNFFQSEENGPIEVARVFLDVDIIEQGVLNVKGNKKISKSDTVTSNQGTSSSNFVALNYLNITAEQLIDFVGQPNEISVFQGADFYIYENMSVGVYEGKTVEIYLHSNSVFGNISVGDTLNKIIGVWGQPEESYQLEDEEIGDSSCGFIYTIEDHRVTLIMKDQDSPVYSIRVQ